MFENSVFISPSKGENEQSEQWDDPAKGFGNKYSSFEDKPFFFSSPIAPSKGDTPHLVLIPNSHYL